MRPVAGYEGNGAASRHARQGMLDYRQLGIPVDAHGILAIGGHQIALQATGGVEHQDIEVVAPGAELGEEAFQVFGASDIAADPERPLAVPGDLFGHFLRARSLIAIGDRHIVATRRQGERGGSAYAS